jgi:hypothetical protein
LWSAWQANVATPLIGIDPRLDRVSQDGSASDIRNFRS